MQVTSNQEDVLDGKSLQRLQVYPNCSLLIDFLRTALVRDHNHRPEIRSLIQKYGDLFGSCEVDRKVVCLQQKEKDIDNLIDRYVE